MKKKTFRFVSRLHYRRRSGICQPSKKLWTIYRLLPRRGRETGPYRTTMSSWIILEPKSSDLSSAERCSVPVWWVLHLWPITFKALMNAFQNEFIFYIQNEIWKCRYMSEEEGKASISPWRELPVLLGVSRGILCPQMLSLRDIVQGGAGLCQ